LSKEPWNNLVPNSWRQLERDKARATKKQISFQMTSFHIVAVLFLTVSNTSFVAIKGFLSPRLPYVNNKVPQKILISNQLLSRAVNRKVTSTDGGFRRGYHGRAKEKRNDSRKEIFAGTLNLIKAMVGTGILALPMGVAKTSDFELSIIPAIALMAILGSISAYTFSLYGRLIHTSKAKTLGELWEKNVDKKSSMYRVYSSSFIEWLSSYVIRCFVR